MKHFFNLKLKTILLSLLCNTSFLLTIQAQTTVSTIAGSGASGSLDGPALSATFNLPNCVAVDALGSIYVADLNNNKIRKITNGIVSTYAGTGAAGSTDGNAASASFNSPGRIVLDASGNLYVSDINNNKIRKISSSGIVSTLAGNGIAGYVDGPGSTASFNNPVGITIDALGNLYLADVGNKKIRKITPSGAVSTVAGSGATGSTDGIATSASFSFPYGIAIDAFNNLYIADYGNHKIRKITPSGIVSTFAGSGIDGNVDGIGTLASFSSPCAITIDVSGNLYVSDVNKIRKVTPEGEVSTIAGSELSGSQDGIGSLARFSSAWGTAIDKLGNLYVADRNNYRIRKITLCNAPNITTNPFSQTTCAGTTASFSIAATGDGLTYQWQKEGTNISGAISSTLSLTNVSAADAANYSCVITGTCGTITSNAASLNVQTTTAPTTSSQLFCSSPMPTVAQLTATGNAILWYTASSGGTALVSNAVLTTGTYYASQTVNGCESPRASANVTVQNTVAPVATAQSFCASQNPTVAQLTASGTAIQWYASSSGGTALGGSVVLTSGIYYASQTVNGCEGPRTSASITVQTTATPVAAAQSFCASQNPTVAQLIATGTAIKWYTTSTGGLTLPLIAPLSTATYYASQTVSGCESSRIPVSINLTAAAYALSNVDAVCSSSFSVPLQTVGAIKSGLIGLDFTLNYDQTLVTPTGTASLGAVPTSYGDYSLNVSTPGKVVVSLYIKNAPSNTFFNGTGNIISINFNVNAGAAIGSTGALTTSLIEESTVIGAATSCNTSTAVLKIVGVVGGKIIYRDDATNDLGYDASSPSLYAPTVITGYGSNCSTQVGVSVMPNNTGIFSYNLGNGSTLKIERDVKGNFNLPPLECTNVQSVINSADYQLALTIANSSYSTPSLYELMSADVNQDGKVTAGDVSLISSRSINQYNCEFPQAWNYTWNGTSYVPKSTYAKSKDWIFVPDVYATSPSFVLNMGRNKVPQLPTCLPAPPGTAACTASANTIYHALLLGDVNANWTKAANGSQVRESVSKEIFFDLPNAIVNGSSKTIPVYYSGELSFSGIDFSIDYTSGITITGLSGADGVVVQWNNIEGQRLMVSAYANEKLTGNYPVLYLTLTTNEDLTATSFISTSGYLNGETANMRFDASSAMNAGSGIQAEIFPNPSNGITYLYTTDAAAFVKVSIYHTNGTLVYENANVPANENAALPELKAGVYVLKVSGTSGETTKKVVRY
jgi:hypothetical protein